jgi:hypothetical protein
MRELLNTCRTTASLPPSTSCSLFAEMSPSRAALGQALCVHAARTSGADAPWQHPKAHQHYSRWQVCPPPRASKQGAASHCKAGAATPAHRLAEAVLLRPCLCRPQASGPFLASVAAAAACDNMEKHAYRCAQLNTIISTISRGGNNLPSRQGLHRRRGGHGKQERRPASTKASTQASQTAPLLTTARQQAHPQNEIPTY